MRMRVRGESMKFLDGERQADPGSKACEPVRDWGPENPQPCSNAEICKMSPEAYREWKMTGKKPAIADDLEQGASAGTEASEEFARNSDRLRGYDSGRPSADAMAAMTPIQRFVAASNAKNRLNPRYAADARRRRSE
jgi:hypothetical protein